MGFLSSFIKQFKLRKIFKNYDRVICLLSEQKIEESLKLERKTDDDFFEMVLKDPDIYKIIEQHNINEEQLRIVFRYLISSGGAQFIRGGYIPAASIAILPTLTYLCDIITQRPELLDSEYKSSSIRIPKNKIEWHGILQNLISHFESMRPGPVKEVISILNTSTIESNNFIFEEKNNSNIENLYDSVSKEWLSIAKECYENHDLYNHVNSNQELLKGLFMYLENIAKEFLKYVTSPEINHKSEGFNYVLGFNRIAEEYNTNNQETVKIYKQHLELTLYLGMLTHINTSTFPTRNMFKQVDLNQIKKEWFVNAICADVEMNGYDHGNPVSRCIFKQYYVNRIKPSIQDDLKIGSIKMGKVDAYFWNLFLAGVFLVFVCDLATKSIHKI
jgi:hypothetical protein